ncbi:MAG: hypothetical protein H3C48_00965 [Chitinophagaceae bacterium]|nr:hypothetical protein [Chitinophagaceae bacterium]
MVKYLNSPLKFIGCLLIVSGSGIAIAAFGQLMFLGISVVAFGLLIQLTAGIFFKDSANRRALKWIEAVLAFFVLSFCSLLILDFYGVIKIPF